MLLSRNTPVLPLLSPLLDAATSTNSLAQEDQPVFKLTNQKKADLTDTEVLANVLGGDQAGLSAHERATLLLMRYGNSLRRLRELSLAQLQRQPELTKKQARIVYAALELGSRATREPRPVRVTITRSQDIVQHMRPILEALPHEEFHVMLVSRANVVQRVVRIGEGGISGVVADPRLILKHALDHLSSGIILIHNHPSGNRAPSSADIEHTHKVKGAAKLFDIALLDHVIVAQDTYYSFADEGML